METKSIFSAHHLSRLGILIALMLVLSYTPLGYLPLGPISITTMHLPVVLGAILGGVPYGLVLGFVFGLSSMLRGIQGLSGPLSFVFMNPLVSVLPRVCFGLIVGFLADRLRNKNIILSATVPALVGTVAHTAMVMTMLYLLFGEQVASNQSLSASAVVALVWATVIGNGIPEAILAAVVATPVARLLRTRIKF